MSRSRPLRRGRAALALLVVTAAPAFAQDTPPEPQPGAPVVVRLDSGETLRGVLADRTADAVAIDHPLLGRITLPAASIASLVADPDATPPIVQPTPPGPIIPVEAPADVPSPSKPRLGWFEGWEGSFDLGLAGSEGNTERLSLRTGINAKRLTDETSTTIDARYFYAKDGGDTTDNKFRLDVRNDWLPTEGSRWRPFVQGSVEWDQFQDWDVRISAHAGLGYEFIKTDTTLFIGRLGLGFAREFGGEDNDFHLEGLLGADFEHRISDRQKISATADYFPNLSDFGEYRIVAKAAWEILLDPESNIALKIGIEDRYDSDPGDAKRNDLDYFATIVIPF